MASKSSNQEEHAEKQEPGISWKQNEEHVIPENRLGIVSFALMCTMFLGALDHVSCKPCRFGFCPTIDCKTIVAIALPTIVAHLQGGSKYSWVGKCVVFDVFSSLHR